MSPYQATMVEVVECFSTSPERVEILWGLLQYRNALVAAGLVNAFQWLDGSFVENVEVLESRSPGDVDVVTFFRRPVPDEEWRTWFLANRNLFTPAYTKATYRCDAYGVDLGTPPENVVRWTRYWFGLFSHKRVTKQWKGMVQIQLSAEDNAAAAARLRELAP